MLYFLIPLLQICFTVYAVRAGRDRIGIFILLFLPGIGILAYIAVELLPGVLGSRTACRLQSHAISWLDTSREARRRRKEPGTATTVDSACLLAETLLADGKFAEALELY